jgi:molecular chaperone GrpE
MKRRDKSEFDPSPSPSPSEDAAQSEGTFASGADGAEADFEAEEVGDGTEAIDGPFADFERRLSDQEEKYLRLAAEYDNYRKRTMRERAELTSRAQAELVKQLVDALDDLARFAHVDPATTDAVTIVQGVDMVEKKFLKMLTAAGLEIVDPVNQSFDPTLHEAVATEPALSPEDDHVVARVFQVGYLFGGQLLRPARVVVKQWNGWIRIDRYGSHEGLLRGPRHARVRDAGRDQEAVSQARREASPR